MGAEIHQRETWVGKLDFILALIGFSVGLGNVWRFPYLCYKNGGGCFLIPYFICLIVAGVPILVLEVSLGQFMSQGGITIWKICPLFNGVGFASMVILNFLSVYYIVILAWSLFYMFHSFTSHLAWSDCTNPWNTPACYDGRAHGLSGNLSLLNSSAAGAYGAMNVTNVTQALEHKSPILEFWERRALQISTGLDDIGHINWEMSLCLLLGWIICYFCVWKGVKSSGRVVYFTATFPYVLITILMVRAVTLPGASLGLEFYLKPVLSRLADAEVWLDAATQVMYSYSLGLGTMMALGSYNKYNNNCYRDCIIFALVNSGTSLYSGCVIFSVVGFMAQRQGVPVSEVAESGPGLAFIAYPAAVAEMPISPLWSICFFFMLILLGLDSQFVGVEGFVTAIVDIFPDTLRRGYRKEIFIAVVCLVWFLIGLPMVSQGGMYIFQLLDSYAVSGSALLWICLFESIAIGWIYGADRYYNNLRDMLGFRINPWLKICWKFLTPAFCTGVFIFNLVKHEPLVYNKVYEYPVWGQGIGWAMAVASMICIPTGMAVQLLRTEGTFVERVKKLIEPRLQDFQLGNYAKETEMTTDTIKVVSENGAALHAPANETSPELGRDNPVVGEDAPIVKDEQ